MTKMIRSIAAALAAAGVFTIGGTAAAEKMQSVRATAVVQGSGTAIRIGEKSAVVMGLLEGVIFVATKTGVLHTAKLLCPVRAMVAADLTQTVDGHCVITDIDGDQIYAKLVCKGVHLHGCAGDFTLDGGTGKFQGLKGSGPFTLLSTMQELYPGKIGVASQSMIGLVTWPKLQYRMKKKPAK